MPIDLSRILANAATTQQAPALPLSVADAHRLARHGVYLLEQKNLEDASLAASLAVAVIPDDYVASLLHGCCLAQKHQAREALAAYARAERARPRELRPYVDAGEVLLSLGDYPAAAAKLKRALELDPEGATPAGHRAHMLVMRVLSAVNG